MREAPVHHANAFIKFRLLMWKNFLQQVRHPIQTAVELIIPVLTMTMILIFRWQIEPVVMRSMEYRSLPANSMASSWWILRGMETAQLSMAYSPTSPALNEAVKSAVLNLFTENARDILPYINLPPHIDYVDPYTAEPEEVYALFEALISFNGYANSEALRNIYGTEAETRSVIAGIEFDDTLFGAQQLSSNLSYSIRFPERLRSGSFYWGGGRNWRTDRLFPFFEIAGPREGWSDEGGSDPGYVEQMFIALQQAISTELIATLTEDEEIKSFRVNIQRLPHPEYIYDLAITILQLIFSLLFVLSFSYSAINIVRAITSEKESQLKGTMKLMGLPTWLHWTAWFAKQFLFFLFSAILLVILLKVNWFTNEDGFSDYAVFTNTPWTVLLFYIMLYLTCTIFFCFMVSGFFYKGTTAALFTGLLWFISYLPTILVLVDTDLSTATQVLLCLSINAAMANGFQLMIGRDSVGGLQWGSFFASPATDSNNFSFGHVVLMLCVDCVLYMLIALYLEQVFPGPIGTPQPWYFPFQFRFWCPRKNTVSDISSIVANGNHEVAVKESEPEGLNAGVKIQNLTKTFGPNIAVNNLSLNIYDDHITVLLGHNGAGKSTTLSMLTGNLEVTHGNINVAGYDMSTQITYARDHIGLCPQHNVFFNELTVKEHLIFFASLKGYKGIELELEVDNLIKNLELQEKRDSAAKGLSGGQKRRLCVGMALSGGAKVVLLDEPTSGMDPASRRSLWELLQREKEGRSVILTTHFMDEADILGDRVAIMANGQLQCVGSPYFLKQHYGAGYTLVIVKDYAFSEDKCAALIEKYIPGIKVKEDRGTEMTYTLLNEHSSIYETMLTDLENNKADIGFTNYGLTATTMEDVFMSVGSDVPTGNKNNDDTEVTIEDTPDPNQEIASSIGELDRDENSLSGIKLMVQRVLAIWMKLWLVLSRSWLVIGLQFLSPIILLNLTLSLLDTTSTYRPSTTPRPLTLAQGFRQTETLLSYNGTSETAFGALASTAYRSVFESLGIPSMGLTYIGASDMEEYYLNRVKEPVDLGELRHQILIGSTFDEDSATAWFSNFGYHDIAISLATVHSAMLRARHGTATINVQNHPLEATYGEQSNTQSLLGIQAEQIASSIGNSMSIVSAVFVMFYIKERVSGAKLLQKAAGVSPALLWGSAAVFDWIWFLITCLSIMISCVAHDVIGLSSTEELGYMFLAFMVFGAAMLPLNYLFSLLFNRPALGFVILYFLNSLFGSVGPQIVDALSFGGTQLETLADVLDFILQFFPLYGLVTSVRSVNSVGLARYLCMESCEQLLPVMPGLECTMESMCEQSPNTCCIPDNPYPNWSEPGIARYFTCMAISCVLFWAILMIIEYRLIQKVWRYQTTPPPLDSSIDEDVAKEAALVKRTGHLPNEHALLAQNLTKYYGKNLAVNQVSFTVSDGECFGLLGVNGAGKTTTFKMLMGDETISYGDAYVSGYSVQTNLYKVHENIGYCPQFDALFEEMTCRNTIRMFAMMRGLRKEIIGSTVETLAAALGFTKHLDKRVNQVSGGTKRKVNTSVAFLGRSRLVFMDEPTTGIDPAAKRQMWRATQNIQRAGRGVVLTSHSMEECEALCSRLTIMVNGRFQCLGTPQHLKNKFSQGFTLTIKLRRDERGTETTESDSGVEAVKNYITYNFKDPKIMEEYQGLLTYYLPERSTPWSKMFGIMERAKRDLDVEDYSISQTSLEQIFLQFTKYQNAVIV